MVLLINSAEYARHKHFVNTIGGGGAAVTVAQSLKRRTFPRNVYMVTINPAARNALLSIFANTIVKNIHASSARGMPYANTISGGAPVSIVRVQVYAFIKSKGEIVFNARGAGYANM